MLFACAKEQGRMPRAILRGGPHLVSAAVRHGHDHVVGFAHAHQQPLPCKRLHRHTVGRHHRERAGRRVHIKVSGRPRIDQPQLHTLARCTGQLPTWRAVGPEGVVGHIRDIHWRHVYPLVLEIIIQHPGTIRTPQALLVTLANGVPFIAAPQRPHHRIRMFIRPVGQHHHMFAVKRRFIRIGNRRHHHDGAVHPALFLQAHVRVVPVGARVFQLELVIMRSPRRNGRRVQHRHPVLSIRHQQTVPVQ